MNESLTKDCSRKSRCLLTPAFVALGLVLVAGCRLGQPGSAAFASVTIEGKTQQEICQTAGAVFQEAGYRVRALDPNQMVFDREGTRGEAIAYGGVVDTYYGSSTAVRVKAELVDLGMGKARLQCQAYMVRNANDSFFQDESALVPARSGPYQSLLNKVAKRLK
jgi:hypothetical protein